MIRTYAVFSVIVTAVCGGIIAAAMALGTQRPAPASAVNFVDCDIPCWRGIILEQSNQRDAQHLLEAADYRWRSYGAPNRGDHFITYEPRGDNPVYCDVRLDLDPARNSSRIVGIGLTACEGLRLGDVMRLVGDPERVVPPLVAMRAPLLGTPGFGNVVTFMDGRVIANVEMRQRGAWFTPYSKVISLNIYAAPPYAEDTPSMCVFAWHGFTNQTHYHPTIQNAIC